MAGGPIRELLTTAEVEVSFIAGCEENQAQLYAQFDLIDHEVRTAVPLPEVVRTVLRLVGA